MAEQSKLSAVIAELKRRRVFRVAAFYGGIAFVIMQIIDGTFDLIDSFESPSDSQKITRSLSAGIRDFYPNSMGGLQLLTI